MSEIAFAGDTVKSVAKRESEATFVLPVVWVLTSGGAQYD